MGTPKVSHGTSGHEQGLRLLDLKPSSNPIAPRTDAASSGVRSGLVKTSAGKLLSAASTLATAAKAREEA
jgi:hypothetical protein